MGFGERQNIFALRRQRARDRANATPQQARYRNNGILNLSAITGVAGYHRLQRYNLDE